MIRVEPPYTTTGAGSSAKKCREADRKNEQLFKKTLKRCSEASKLLDGLATLEFDIAPPPPSNATRAISSIYQGTCSVRVAHTEIPRVQPLPSIGAEESMPARAIQAASSEGYQPRGFRASSPEYGFGDTVRPTAPPPMYHPQLVSPPQQAHPPMMQCSEMYKMQQHATPMYYS